MMHLDKLPSGITIYTSTEVFPLGQDSILLADFARPHPKSRILDLGCGAGVLSLLLLDRYPNVTVTALDCDFAAYSLAYENCITNDLQARMEVVHGDFKQVKTIFEHATYHYVICNPPYFPCNTGAAHTSLPTARQQIDCTITDVVKAAAFCLKGGGKCAFVYRPERLCSLLCALCEAKLAPKRLRFVHQRTESTPSAVMVEAKKGAKEGLIVLPPLLIEEADGRPSKEYRQIYHI